MQQGAPKRWYPTAKLQGVTIQQTSTCKLVEFTELWENRLLLK